MELWRTIPGHPDYEVSNLGNVRSKDKYVKTKKGWSYFSKGRILKPWSTTSGYLVVQLDSHERVQLHRIVAQVWIENPHSKPIINHIDGNKHNNKVDNLEWSTYSENVYHAKETGLAADRVAVKQIDPNTNQVLATYKSLKEAAKCTGIDYSSIAYCARGEYKTSGGFKWERATTSRKA